MEFLIRLSQQSQGFDLVVLQFIPDGTWIRFAASYTMDFAAHQAACDLLDLLVALGAEVYLEEVKLLNEA